MWRVEIISTEAVQQDFISLLEQEAKITHYSVIPNAQGAGSKGKRLGDAVWPERNFVLICYTEEQGLKDIEAITKKVKALFPSEGITMFSVAAREHNLKE